jgi:ABC-type nickel/cobalt efflux system permease component RcnA
MLTFLTGLIASIAHVVTGPDHLAAVTPLAIDSRKKSWIIGCAWGVGHTIGMLLIGLLFILFKAVLPVEAILKHSNTVIGFLLIGIGTWAIIRIYIRHYHGNKPHIHFHTKPSFYPHIHRHTHEIHAREPHHGSEFIDGIVPDHGHVHAEKVKQNAFAAFSIGVIHGFAGFSHLFALLPSLALPAIGDSVIYVVAFAFGTIITMMLFAFILGMVAFTSVMKNKFTFLKWFSYAGAVLAIAIGILWIVHPV